MLILFFWGGGGCFGRRRRFHEVADFEDVVFGEIVIVKVLVDFR